MFKSKTKLGNNLHLKDRISKDLTSGAVYMFYRGLCNGSSYGQHFLC